MKKTDKIYYTAKEAQDILGMTYSALRNQVGAGNIKSIVPPGRRQAVYDKKDVDRLERELNAFMMHRTTKPTQLLRVSTKEEMIECVEISQVLFGVGRDMIDERIKIIEKNPDTYYMLKSED